jgi:hypothetical protein
MLIIFFFFITSNLVLLLVQANKEDSVNILVQLNMRSKFDASFARSKDDFFKDFFCFFFDIFLLIFDLVLNYNRIARSVPYECVNDNFSNEDYGGNHYEGVGKTDHEEHWRVWGL